MPVRLIVFPHSDEHLREAADACLSDSVGTPERLTRCLRADYPRIVVHKGVEIAGDNVWYVYREGHWIAD